VLLGVEVVARAPGGKKTAAGLAVAAPNATASIAVRVRGADGKALAGAQVCVCLGVGRGELQSPASCFKGGCGCLLWWWRGGGSQGSGLF
jgi:hypothetical protein